MNLTDAIASCFNKYVDFSGRASRSEYWWFFLFCTAGSAIFSLISDAVSGIFTLATLLPSIAVGARRLHDINKSGWIQVSWLIGYTVGMILMFLSILFGASTHSSISPYFITGALIILVSTIYWIFLSVKPSDIGENQYGETP